MNLKKKISVEIKAYFEKQTDTKFKDSIFNTIMDGTDISLPNDFLKRWIKYSNEKPISDEELENEYDAFAKNLKWSLIVNKIGEENKIEPEKDELNEFSKELLKTQLAMYQPGQPVSETDLQMLNESMMKREDHVKKTYDALMEQKIVHLN